MAGTFDLRDWIEMLNPAIRLMHSTQRMCRWMILQVTCLGHPVIGGMPGPSLIHAKAEKLTRGYPSIRVGARRDLSIRVDSQPEAWT